MEEEVRQILTKAVLASEKLSDIFNKHFGVKNGIELTIPKRNKAHKPLDFSE